MKVGYFAPTAFSYSGILTLFVDEITNLRFVIDNKCGQCFFYNRIVIENLI